MTYWPRDDDNAEVKSLGQTIRDHEARIVASRIEIRKCEERVDAVRLMERPAFPTDEQRRLLGLAADVIKAKTKPDSHLGDVVEPGNYTVVADGARGWLSIRDGSPYAARSGHKLWSFSDEEVAAFKTILNEHGLEPVDHWLHSEGVSIVSRVSRPAVKGRDS